MKKLLLNARLTISENSHMHTSAKRGPINRNKVTKQHTAYPPSMLITPLYYCKFRLFMTICILNSITYAQFTLKNSLFISKQQAEIW